MEEVFRDQRLPHPSEAIPVEAGAEALVALLAANGVKYIFVNPGSDLIPVFEAVARFKCQGRLAPDFILCQHESLAMTAAQGYFMSTGSPQVVMVHLDVGTQQVGGALHNAQRGQAGVILCAGRSPWTFEGEMKGGRNIPVDFRTEQFDQASIVRPYVKWDYDLKCNDNIQHVVQRAFQVAGAEPHGPVYLTIARELLMQKMTSVLPLSPEKYGPPATPQADKVVLEEAARLLAAARDPLFITSTLGRHPEAVPPFVKLAEMVGAHVASTGVRMNFPAGHVLSVEDNVNPHVAGADVILMVDTLVPYIPARARPSPQAKVIDIDIDPVKASMPTYNFPADVRIQADSRKVIPVLAEAVAGMMDEHQRSRARERMEKRAAEAGVRRAQWQSAALARARDRPMASEWVAYCLGQEVDDDAILVDEAISYRAGTVRHLGRTRPGISFRADGSSLGWGLGYALGLKLANPDRTVVCLTGDGSFLYGYPTATFWSAARYRAPFLNIVYNNSGYWTMDRIIESTYGKDCFYARTEDRPATSFQPSPDYAMIARASGAWAERVEDPAVLRDAIRNGLNRVKEGQPAVVEVVVGRK